MIGLRTAIVGAGLMGGWHARCAKKAGAGVAAIIDIDPERAASLESGFPGSRVFASLEECLESVEIDAVHVCVPLEHHFPLARISLQAGKHVLLEKPAASSERETKELIDAAKKAGTTLCVAHQFPFQRGVRRLKRNLDALGDIVKLEFSACSAGGEGFSSDARRKEILLEILPHPVSLFYSLLGGLKIGASWNVIAFTSDDLAIMGSVDKTILEINISLRGRPTRNELTVTGSLGSAHVNLFHGYCFFEFAKVSRMGKIAQPFKHGVSLLTAAGVNLLQRIVRWEPAYPGLEELVSRFYSSIRLGGSPPVREEEMIEAAGMMDWARARAGAVTTGDTESKDSPGP